MPIPIRKGIDTLQEGGLSVFTVRTLRYLGLWSRLWNTATSRHQFGTNVFEREWDLLVVLDTCRPDFLREFKDTYPWLGQVEEMRSVGSMSGEWVLKTFTEEYREEIERTAFVCRNAWASSILDDRIHEQDNDSELGGSEYIRHGNLACTPVTSQAFRHFEWVYPPNQDDCIHPEAETNNIPHIVTDRAIDVSRSVEFDRLIVWYMMPHLSFIAEAVNWSPDMDIENLMSGPEPVRELRPEEKSYQPVEQGKVSRERMRKLYQQNLAFVLSYVDILLQNINAENAVITADHGEGLGENAIWGHPYGCPWPPVKTVPWAQTTATDEKTYVSQFNGPERELLSEDRLKALEQMGYI